MKISINEKYHQVFLIFLMDEELIIISRGLQYFVVVGNNILVVYLNIFLFYAKSQCNLVDHSHMATNHVFVSCRGSGRVADQS